MVLLVTLLGKFPKTFVACEVIGKVSLHPA